MKRVLFYLKGYVLLLYLQRKAGGITRRFRSRCVKSLLFFAATGKRFCLNLGLILSPREQISMNPGLCGSLFFTSKGYEIVFVIVFPKMLLLRVFDHKFICHLLGASLVSRNLNRCIYIFVLGDCCCCCCFFIVKCCGPSTTFFHCSHNATNAITPSSVKFLCAVVSPDGSTTTHNSGNEELTDPFHYQMEPNLHKLQGRCEVDIVISFSTLMFGNFGQVLVLDFGNQSHLSVEMNIEVGSQEFLEEFSEKKSHLNLDWTLWDDGSREIVKSEAKSPSVFNNEHLIDKYQLPRAEEIVPTPLLDKFQGLNQGNYAINVMHQLLFVGEVYIRKQIAR